MIKKIALFSSMVTLFFFAPINAGQLHLLIKLNDIQAATELIKKNQGQNEILDEIFEGRAPLHIAVEYNQPTIVGNLLLANANPNVVSALGQTPLVMALKIEDPDERDKILNELIEYGATLDGREFYDNFAPFEEFVPKQKTINARFIKLLGNLIYQEPIRLNFANIYQIFISDDFDLFYYFLTNENVKKNRWMINDILRSIINAEFPNGLPSPKAIAVLNDLFTALSSSTELKRRAWLTLKAKLDQKLASQKLPVPKPKLLGTYLRLWEDNDETAFAQAMSTSYAQMFQNITIDDISRWLSKETHEQEREKYLLMQKKTSDFFSYLIVSKRKLKQRKANYTKTVGILNKLLELNNFWSAKHVMLALQRQEVIRLFRPQTTANQFGDISPDKMEILHGHKNIAFEKISAGLLNKTNRILVPDNLLDELSKIYDFIEQYEIENIENIKRDDNVIPILSARYVAFGKIVKELTDHERFASLPFDAAHKNIFASLPILDDGIIAEFSNAHKRWHPDMGTVREEPNAALNVEKWGSLDLYSYFESYVAKEVSDELLFNAGIWDGPTLMKFFNYLETHKRSQLSMLFEDFLRDLKNEVLQRPPSEI